MFSKEIDEIGKRAISIRNVEYYTAEDTIEIIKTCEKYGKEIYGIDAMDYDDPYIGIADSIDYSLGQRIDYDPDEFYKKYQKMPYHDSGYWSESIQFIRDRENTDWIFLITFED